MDDPRYQTQALRKRIRLPDYDYAQQGMYFLTICTAERRCVLGTIADSELLLNDWGKIVEEEWQQTGVLRANVQLDAYVVMPNHFHGVLIITDQLKAGA